MADLNPSQISQIKNYLTNKSNGIGLSPDQANNFVSGGNSGLSNLANRASSSGLGNSSMSSSSLSGGLGSIKSVMDNTIRKSTDVVFAGLIDESEGYANRIGVSTAKTIIDRMGASVSSLATMDWANVVNNIFSAAADGAASFLKDIGKTNASLLEVTNKSGAFVGDMGKAMRDELYVAMEATTKMGMTTEDFMSGTKTLLESSGRMAMYSKQAIAQGVEASIAYTKSSKTLLENNEAFRNVGYGIQDAAREITKAGQKTLELGLNAKVLTDTLVKNLGKLNEFGFQGGIAGLTRMTQQAQGLNMSMDNTFKIANDLFDPNKAIDMAANLSMIGGAIGDFGDPLRMIYDATNNVEGLQTSLINASKSLATYNTEQGRFEVTGANLRRAKQMADTFGISMGDLTSLAVKANVQFQAMSQINLFGDKFNKEQKEFLKNISTLKDGKVGLYIPEDIASKFGNELNGKIKDGFVDFQTFAGLDVKVRDQILSEQKKIQDMKPEDIARGQFTAINQINNVLSAMWIKMQNDARKSGAGKEIGDSMDEAAKRLQGISIKQSTADYGREITQQAIGVLKKAGYVQDAKPTEEQLIKSATNKNGTTQPDLIKSATNSSDNTSNGTTNTNNNQSNNNSQDVKIQMNITANDSTMDAMTRHWSKNLQDLELIGVQINNNPKSFDSTRKVFTKR
jgi:hypothetical protein